MPNIFIKSSYLFSNRLLVFPHIKNPLSISKKLKSCFNQNQNDDSLTNKKYFTTSTSTLTVENQQQLKVEQIAIPVPWGNIRGQIFGNPSAKDAKPMLCLHGFLDNSNSFKPLATYLTRSNEYYMIALDFPGHGHSSKMPDGIPYTQKLMIGSVRRAVRYLNLNKFYFCCHSFGVYISLFYQTIFKDEVIASVSLDWVAPDRQKNMDLLGDLLKKSMDKYIDEDMHHIKKEKHLKGHHDKHEHHAKHANLHHAHHKRELTKETALAILLKHNKSLDEETGKIMLERALIVGSDGKLNFSRDRRVKASMGSADSFSEYVLMSPHIIRNQTSPNLMIHAVPPAYGDKKAVDTHVFLDRIRANEKARIESVFLNGTHHLHMIKPKETSEVIFDFLNKLNQIK